MPNAPSFRRPSPGPARATWRLLATLALCAVAASAAVAAEPPPAWAYPVNPPDFKPVPDDGTLRRVPGSSVGYTLSQTRDRFLAPDWHPADQPPMPEVVARGRKPDVYACSYCHRAGGPGGPENAPIAGLPVAYILQQMADFKSGARRSSVPQRAPVMLKATLAKAITDDELLTAARHFAALKPQRAVRVVETERVPRTQVAGWVLAPAPGAETEPIAGRIIEVPDDLHQFELRDPRARFTAYAPVGSVQRGAALAAGGLVPACASCHGPDLKGLGAVPPIAGRSPSYVMRQLFDLRSGARAGSGAAQMKPVVDALSIDDMTSLAAYLATLSP